MKRITIPMFCIAFAALVLAVPALAHTPVGSAVQGCVEENVTLTASASNPGYDETTTWSATDSQAGSLGEGQASPATFNITVPGPDRAAGTVTFTWYSVNSEGQPIQGTIEAPYEAVSGCVGPPPPPPPPPPHQPGPPHIGTPMGPVSGPPQPPKDSIPQPQPTVADAGELPFSGTRDLIILGAAGCALFGAGLTLRRLTQ